MPGSVTDAYDPEFGTGADAAAVRDAVRRIVDEITELLGEELPIVSVVKGKTPDRLYPIRFSESGLRVIRFGLNRALKSL